MTLPLHQYWHSRQVPEAMQSLIDHNLALNPEYVSNLTDEAEAEAFLATHFGSTAREAFTLARPHSFKADLWRFAALAVLGGAYLDVKIRMKRSFAALAPLAHSDGALFTRDAPRGAIWTAIILAPPHNPVIEGALALAIDNCVHRRYGTGPLDVTGPQVFGRAWNALIHAPWDSPIAFGPGARCGLKLATHNAVADPDMNLVAVAGYPDYRVHAPLAERYDTMWHARRAFDEA